MHEFLYNLSIGAYRTAITIASLWNNKARRWVSGRKDLMDNIEKAVRRDKRRSVWIHCSSLGEFEQGRPLIEKLRSSGVKEKIIITFFSPSGYEIMKNYSVADHVFYLPHDTPSNARRFIELIDPSLVIVVKYDHWYHFLNECNRKKIPLLLVSAIFRPGQIFFSWYGSLHRKMLSFYQHIFVQNVASATLLSGINIKNVTTSGDTRFDRVTEIAASAKQTESISSFCGSAEVIVAGSTWPADESMIQYLYNETGNIKFIIAPHEIGKDHIEEIQKRFQESILYSALNTGKKNEARARCLIIDNIGMLSHLYRFGKICYVGGGFGKGIHNILEAAVYGSPVLFGPNHQRSLEAKELIEAGGAFEISTKDQLKERIMSLLNDRSAYERSATGAKEYVAGKTGATGIIYNYIELNRLLTN